MNEPLRTKTWNRKKLIRIIRMSLMICLILSLSSLSMSAVPVPFGKPVFVATITGSSELEPGNITPLTISVRNTGHAPELILDPDDPGLSSPAVGYGVTLTLEPGTAPVDIPANPFTIPILPPDTGVPVTFPVIVPADATAESYHLALRIDSQYAQSVAMADLSNVFTYADQNLTLQIPVSVKSVVRAQVDEISVSNLSPGQDGRITAKIRNVGQYAPKDAIAELVVEPHSLLSPYQGTYFLGTFPPGEERTVEWRASVQDTIDTTSIPASLIISYEDKNGIWTSSHPVVIGIPVGKGPKFTLTYDKPVIEPGGSVSVRVVYTNVGDTPAYDAAAKIVPIAPLSSPQSSIMLGTILPNDSAEAVYEIDLDSSALVKPYGLLTDVKYRGEDNLVTLSDPMQIELETTAPGLAEVLLSPLSLVILLGILLIGGYYYMKRMGRLA
ncbi:hypothetical protein KHC33_11170 [Methanospirillum sp. J.3.6.1-F.2.7.3]|uniref:S-layer protein n=1 Tax=Methanospirillum purgamenti TaxID=2834276 RepID=A0A8E7EG42_9EURY|nr:MULTISPECIES: hypothetical protein [Methanospirillum]MDX8551337.1 hypothetical protein [Methanospirillum hungatei]QVV87898.1 hypothetical protein KHC33_11170 [Methanospirillum sp. J.3.6.1-F.2.7.3]